MKPYLPLLLCSLLPLGACSNNAPEITSIAFAKSYYSLALGESAALTVIMDGEGKSPKFLSGDESVVTITEAGLMQAVGKGETTVFAICNDLIATANVVVTGEEASSIYVYHGNVMASMSLPSFATNATSSFPLKIVLDSSSSSHFYLEATLDQTFLGAFLALENSDFFTRNPDQSLPEAYDEFCAIIEKAPAKVTLKSLYEEGIVTTYAYDKDTLLGEFSIDLESDANVSSALSLLRSVSLSDLEDLDIPSLIYALLPEEETTLLDDTLGKIIKAAITNATITSFKTTDSFSLSIRENSSFGDSLFELLDVDLGENPSLSAAQLSLNYAKENERYAISSLSLRLLASLFGAENEFLLSYTKQSPREEAPSTFFEDLKNELP